MDQVSKLVISVMASRHNASPANDQPLDDIGQSGWVCGWFKKGFDVDALPAYAEAKTFFVTYQIQSGTMQVFDAVEEVILNPDPRSNPKWLEANKKLGDKYADFEDGTDAVDTAN